MILNYLKFFVLRYLYRITTPKALIRFAVKKHGRKIAFVDGDTHITLGELDMKVNRLCHGLLALGIQKGDCLCVLLQNRVEFIELRLASYKCGFIFCALIDDFTTGQRVEMLKETKCRAFFYDDRLTMIDLAAAMTNTKIEFYVPIGENAYQKLLSNNESEPKIKIRPGEISAIGYTSGTTGKSKGIAWTHKAWLYSFYYFLLNNRPGPSIAMTILHVVPFSTAGSLVILPALASGAKNILMQQFDVEKIAATIDHEKVTDLLLPPAFLIELWDFYVSNKPFFNFKSLKRINVGSAILHGKKWKEMIQAFGPIIQQSYGMAEVLAPIASLMVTDPEVEKNKLTSVGKVVKQVKLKIVAADPGNKGTICLHSKTSGQGYWKRESLTRQHFKNGWFITDDIGSLDKEGNLFIAARSANIFEHNGIHIFPRDIEEIIHCFPGVKETVVIEKDGEIKAYISARRNFILGVKMLKQFCSGHLPAYMQPSSFILMDNLPHSTSGKILIGELTSQAYSQTQHV